MEPVPGVTFRGPLELLETPRRALLLSRTPRRPVPATPWVRAVVNAVEASLSRGETLVTGLGREPYDLALAVCRRRHGAAVVVLTGPPADAPRADPDGSLLPARCLLAWPAEAERAGKRETPAALAARDRLIGRLSDRAWAVAIRPDGNMAAVAADLRARGCAIEAAPGGEPPAPGGEPSAPAGDALDGLFPPAPQAGRDGLVRAIGRIGPITLGAPSKTEGACGPPTGTRDAGTGRGDPANLGRDWPYLTHYTREPDGAWPDETREEYLAWLAWGAPEAHREARDALRRILSGRVILASGRLMPGRARMVSFTARPPWELAERARWRRGLRRWDFRGYGLAVRRELVAAAGARPVRYLAREELPGLSPAERLFAQPHDPPASDWSGEAEWRLPGDLRWDALPDGALRIVVPSPDEARDFAREFGLPVTAMSGKW